VSANTLGSVVPISITTTHAIATWQSNTIISLCVWFILPKGKKVPEVCKVLEITEQTYYRWRQKYGGMAPEMAKELKALQQENARLKKLVANQALDMEILREAAKGNW
jgi:putative transposase